MGLDSYFMPNVSNKELGELPKGWRKEYSFPAVNLVGGMLSGDGSNGSFRGQVYSALIKQITGQSLYEERIEPDMVEHVATTLGVFVVDKLADVPDEYVLNYDLEPIEQGLDDAWGVTVGELRDLAILFLYAADHDMILVGWW